MTWIRKLGLMQAFDRFYFFWNRIRFSGRNKKFLKENPDIQLPPDYMLYEAFRLNYQSYFEDGRDTAYWIVELFSEFTMVTGKDILEWGCGPARIIRHLPSIISGGHIYGSDYNVETIEWCREHISDVEFSINGLNPPLDYTPDKFDLIYALSVFTHLSAESHFKWLDEIRRVMRNQGIFVFTTQGDAFEFKLTPTEKKTYGSGHLVERSNVKEGHRSYSAFQPLGFMEKMLGDEWKVLKFIPGSMQQWGPEQDTWIIQKR